MIYNICFVHFLVIIRLHYSSVFLFVIIMLFTVIGYSYHWPAVLEFSFLAACCCEKLLLYWL